MRSFSLTHSRRLDRVVLRLEARPPHGVALLLRLYKRLLEWGIG